MTGDGIEPQGVARSFILEFTLLGSPEAACHELVAVASRPLDVAPGDGLLMTSDERHHPFLKSLPRGGDVEGAFALGDPVELIALLLGGGAAREGVLGEGVVELGEGFIELRDPLGLGQALGLGGEVGIPLGADGLALAFVDGVVGVGLHLRPIERGGGERAGKSPHRLGHALDALGGTVEGPLLDADWSRVCVTPPRSGALGPPLITAGSARRCGALGISWR